jgi:hypothetical protein
VVRNNVDFIFRWNDISSLSVALQLMTRQADVICTDTSAGPLQTNDLMKLFAAHLSEEKVTEREKSSKIYHTS